MSWVTFSRPCGTARWHKLTQDSRPGLLSAVPPGLNLEKVVLTQTLQAVPKCFAMNSALAVEVCLPLSRPVQTLAHPAEA
jgi:hypothetical protein